MLWQRVNRSDPEKMFVVVKNSWSTATVTNGQPVMWDYITDQDGVGVTRGVAGPAKHGGFAMAGVMAESVAAGSYGLCQVYGYHSAGIAQAITGGGTTVATGTPLGLQTATFVLTPIAVSMGSASATLDRVLFPSAFSLGLAVATWTTANGAIFIKAL
jgi:hypothetical protein